jgi:hypothetical protein
MEKCSGTGAAHPSAIPAAGGGRSQVTVKSAPGARLGAEADVFQQ